MIRYFLLISAAVVAFNLGSNDLPTVLGTFTTSQIIYIIGAIFYAWELIYTEIGFQKHYL